ncbi:MAG: hypothetical protein COA58_08065 [Bacteroidetes bacterium]|nr:MAG: hypothetical protein COA58_08065 [Bacteroidota bacterium]
MGLFDAFKKKVKVKAEEVNPLHGYLKEANLPIENLQVVDVNGTVTVTGIAQDGESAAKVEELLKARGIVSVTNNISIADLSAMNMKFRVATNSSNLNCRKGPSTNDEIVGKFSKDTIVILVQKYNSSWHKVRSEQIEGFCHTDYLESV